MEKAMEERAPIIVRDKRQALVVGPRRGWRESFQPREPSRKGNDEKGRWLPLRAYERRPLHKSNDQKIAQSQPALSGRTMAVEL